MLSLLMWLLLVLSVALVDVAIVLMASGSVRLVRRRSCRGSAGRAGVRRSPCLRAEAQAGLS